MALGDLVIRMAADVASFQSDLGRAVHLAERSSQQISRAFARAQSTLAGLGVGLSFAGLTAFIKSGIDAAAQLDDLAEKTGASVEELSKLSQVARISGTDMGVVEGFIIRLNKALNDTDEEAKGANRALAAIGLSAQELRALDPAEAMRRIAIELNKFADGGGKTAAVLALTGKSAAEALPFLRDLATEVGITARVTAEQAAQAEELQKSYRRLTNASIETGQALARDMVPWLTRIVEQMSEGIRIAGGFGSAILTLGTINPFKSTGENVRSLAQDIENLNAKRARFIEQGRRGWIPQMDAELEKLKKQKEFVQFMQRQEALAGGGGRGRLDAKDVGPGGGRVLDFMKGGGNKGGGGASPFDTALRQLEDEAMRVQELTRFQEVLAAIEKGRYGKLLPAQRDALLNAAAALDLAKEDARVQKEATAATEAYLKAEQDRIRLEDERLTRIAEGALDSIDSTRAWKRSVDDLTEAYKRGLLTIQEMNAAAMNPRLRALLEPVKTDMDILNEALREGDISLEKYLETVKRINSEQEKVAGIGKDIWAPLESALERAIVKGEDLSDVLKALEKDLLAIGTRKLVTEPLGKWFDQQLSGMGGGLFSMLGLGGGFGSSAVSGGVSVFDGFAEGTDFVPRTGPYLLHKGEAVIPADQNGGGVVINMTVNTPDAASFRASRGQIAADMSDAASRAMRRFR